MAKIKDNKEEEPKIVSTKISCYSVECPYCKKMLQSQYIKQVNQFYKSHVDNCKKNPRNQKDNETNKQTKPKTKS